MSVLTYSGATAPMASLLFEAPTQPSFNALDTGAVWDGEGRTIADFIAEMFDPLVASGSGYVSRSVLGRDASNTYDILQYDFNPPGATQTILLSFGAHGRETVPVYSAYRLAHYLINSPDTHPYFRYLRDKVRIKMIPALGIWAGSQSPKVYGNANGWNLVRNFAVHREYIEASPAQFTNYRGPSVYSEAEAGILRDWLAANTSASFYADWHTDYSFKGQAPTRDVWVFRSEFDSYTRPIIDSMADLLGVRAGSLVTNVSVTKEDGLERVSSGKYATEVLGIPWFTAEYAETRYGGRFGGSQDIRNHLTMMVNFINAMCRGNLRQRITADTAATSSFISDYKFPPTNLYSDKVNLNWGLPATYSAFDSLASAHPGYASVANIGADASGTYQLRAMTLDPGGAEDVVCIIGGKDAASANTAGIETSLILRLAQFMCDEAAAHGYSHVRSRTKLILIPTMNPWGYNANAVDLESVDYAMTSTAGYTIKSDLNSAGVRPAQDVGPSATVPEAVVLKNYLAANVPTTACVIGLGSTPSVVTVINVRRHASANPAPGGFAVSLGNSLLAARAPFDPAAVVTLNNNVANGNMADGLYQMGYSRSMTINLGQSAFRVAGTENIPNNRPTAQAYLAYLLDLIRAVTQ